MRRKIQRSMILVIAATLLVSMALLTFVVYRQNVGLMEEEARQEAGYICAAIEASGSAYLEEMDAQQEETRVTWIGSDGDVLYDSSEGQEDMENHADRPEVREAFQSGAGQDIRESDTLGRQMFYYAQRLSDGSVLRVSKTISSALGSALQILPGMAVIAVLMVGLAWMLSKWQVSKLIEPINKLDLEHPLENDVYEELTPLLESMDKQNKEKEAIANMRKEFSANVSHELKTPLTVILANTGILLSHPQDSIEQQKRWIQNTQEEAVNMKKLVDDMLFLAKSDAAVSLVYSEVNFSDVVWSSVLPFESVAFEQGLSLDSDIAENMNLLGDEGKLRELVRILLDNACKYCAPKGKIFVRLEREGEKERFLLSVKNTVSEKMSEQELERMFERFYRADKARNREKGGYGLGLAIAKSIVDQHHGKISASYPSEDEIAVNVQFRMKEQKK